MGSHQHLQLHQDPRAKAFYQNPYPFYRRWQDTGPFVYWADYGFWCATRFAEVDALLRDRRFGRQILHRYSREELGWPPPPAHLQAFAATEAHSLLCLEPPAHTRLRAHINHAFLARQMAAEERLITALAEQLCDLLPTPEAELLHNYAAPLAARTIARLLGVDARHTDQLLSWSHSMVHIYTMQQTRAEEGAANQAATEFTQFLRNLLAERKLQPRDDLLTTLLAGKHPEQALSDDEIISMAILLLNAGHEATVHQFGNAVHTLLQWEPGLTTAQAWLTDPERCDRLVSELMRFDPPLHLFTRYALEPVELADGIRLEPGDQIGLLLGSANHDSRRFSMPGQFNPQRADPGHVSLGAGIHYCAGAALAKLELAVALRVLIERKPGLHAAAPLRYRDSYHFHGLQALPVRD